MASAVFPDGILGPAPGLLKINSTATIDDPPVVMTVPRVVLRLCPNSVTETASNLNIILLAGPPGIQFNANPFILGTADLFQVTTILQNQSGVPITLTPVSTLDCAPTFRANNAVLTSSNFTTALPAIAGLKFRPTFSVVGVGTGTCTDAVALMHRTSVAAGWTLTDSIALRYLDDIADGTITNQVVIDIAALTRATLNLSLRSAGATVQMRHAGPVSLGANQAPSANVTVDVTGSYATRTGNVTAVNGTNDDLAIGNLTFIRITGPSAAFTITSMTPTADGKRITIFNSTTQNMTVSHEAASGTAANRFHSTSATSYISTGEGICEAVYSTDLSRWLFTNKGEV